MRLNWLLNKICQKLELILGFNKTTEFMNSRLVYYLNYRSISNIIKHPEKIIVVTAWMPAYIDNIQEVLLKLNNEGFRVVIFPEWNSFENVNYSKEISKYTSFDILFDAHRALPKINCFAFLSSTATKHYYFAKTHKRYFYFHSVAGLDGFPLGGLDDYMHYLCATKQQFRELTERFDKLPMDKTLICAGYPKFDRIVTRLESTYSDDYLKKEYVSILIAPSYAAKNVYADITMLDHVEEIIESLLKKKYFVIFRPHPVSLRRGSYIQVISNIKKKYLNHKNFEFDNSQDYFDTYKKSDVMLTDVSGTSMMFKIAFKKPVIFYTPNINKAVSAFEAIPDLGKITDKISEISLLLSEYNNTTCQQNSEIIFNLGASVDSICRTIMENKNE